MNKYASTLIKQIQLSPEIRIITEKIFAGERLSTEDALELYNSSNLALLGILAFEVKKKQSAQYVYFNRNFHIEPTNICINHCKFCSYRRRAGQKDAWECSIDEIIEKVKNHLKENVSEVHIVGGVHPDRNLYFYTDMLRAIKKVAPHLHIKAFTAVEIDQMCRMAGESYQKGLQLLKEAGLNSMPGGGAEIFDEKLRAEICPDKTSSSDWLKIHETAHNQGIPTNATILYGLKESYEHRIDHMERLRNLQDKTHGFNAFIPLKFKNYNNLFSHIKETTVIEDLKNYAVSRIFLDNIPHLKAYWPMIGKEVAQLSLSFGVDDLDGTIDDSTKIYSMAGSKEQNPNATTEELVNIIKAVNLTPVLRDTLYNPVKIY
ncbi:MAG: aminofutalosine synthase MqnE [Prolixibacteraceae bacterium]|nr:aminofutalosine synthase MqnE [Prolixibacteraceae bacterium]MBN2774330.1 aminofutalosine synthase MqnE [Prolixibacteraceae bacterium]